MHCILHIFDTTSEERKSRLHIKLVLHLLFVQCIYTDFPVLKTAKHIYVFIKIYCCTDVLLKKIRQWHCNDNICLRKAPAF